MRFYASTVYAIVQDDLHVSAYDDGMKANLLTILMLPIATSVGAKEVLYYTVSA